MNPGKHRKSEKTGGTPVLREQIKGPKFQYKCGPSEFGFTVNITSHKLLSFWWNIL